MATQGQENYYVNTGLTPLPIPHITGMKLQEDISLNDFVFNRVDEFGVVWVITNTSNIIYLTAVVSGASTFNTKVSVRIIS